MSAVKPVAALNVYKKVAIIRGSDDSLTFEDPDGNVKTITDLHLAAVATVSIGRCALKLLLCTTRVSVDAVILLDLRFVCQTFELMFVNTSVMLPT
jgi:hypothetical protein